MSKWAGVKLGAVFLSVKNGASIKQGDEIGFGYPITRIETISNGKVNRMKMGYAGIKDITPYIDYVLVSGDILMSHINSIKHLGKTALYNQINDETIIHGMNLLRLKPNHKLIDSKYAKNFFDSYSFKRQIPRITKNSVNQSSFTVKALMELVIPLPPLSVQQKIADIFACVNALIEKQQAQIEKIDVIIKSRFIEMFGDPVTNPKGWERHQLKEFILFLTSGSRGWSSYFCDAGEVFLTIKNVKNSHLLLDNIQYVSPPDTKEAKRTRVQQNDLLISITADLGRTAIVDAKIAEHGAYINQHLSLLRLDTTQVSPLFISYYLESQAGRRQFEAKNQVGVKSGLNFDAINSLDILLPPLTLQNQFADFVQQTDKLKFVEQTALEMLQLIVSFVIKNTLDTSIHKRQVTSYEYQL